MNVYLVEIYFKIKEDKIFKHQISVNDFKTENILKLQYKFLELSYYNKTINFFNGHIKQNLELKYI